MTRRNDYTIYPTAETIIIDDNIPNNVNEVNWNPNVKFRKYEKYYIRIWAYTNSNTATMSGYCLWSINDVLPEDDLDIEEVVPKKGGKIKKVASSTFIIIPNHVDLTGDDLLDELENSGVYF